jgi:4-hydroxy-tetrahydrodipicolinate reductase
MTEIHHAGKLDSPSGTAISLAGDVISQLPGKTDWVNNKNAGKNELNIKSERRGEVAGVHSLKYESDADFIEITHSAKSRKGFATGAVLAAEYALKNKGILSMKELLNL